MMRMFLISEFKLCFNIFGGHKQTNKVLPTLKLLNSIIQNVIFFYELLLLLLILFTFLKYT